MDTFISFHKKETYVDRTPDKLHFRYKGTLEYEPKNEDSVATLLKKFNTASHSIPKVNSVIKPKITVDFEVGKLQRSQSVHLKSDIKHEVDGNCIFIFGRSC
jgi:hypothetical protein